jgi:hypothetical protein
MRVVAAPPWAVTRDEASEHFLTETKKAYQDWSTADALSECRLPSIRSRLAQQNGASFASGHNDTLNSARSSADGGRAEQHDGPTGKWERSLRLDASGSTRQRRALGACHWQRVHLSKQHA